MLLLTCAMAQRTNSRVYNNLSYGMQTINSGPDEMKSDLALGFTVGRTFYLHKRPIGGVLKIGLDWSILDINYAQYPDLPMAYLFDTNGVSNSVLDHLEDNLGIRQVEAGMGLGPSLNFNPKGPTRLSLFFRVTPSYSAMVQNEELYHHYTTYYSYGLTLGYKVLTLGVEYRWNDLTDYNGVAISRLVDRYYEREETNPIDVPNRGIKSEVLRVILGFHF